MCLQTLCDRATKQRIRLINYVKHIQLKLHVQRHRKNTDSHIQWEMMNDVKSSKNREDPLVPQLLLPDKTPQKRGSDLISGRCKIRKYS